MLIDDDTAALPDLQARTLGQADLGRYADGDDRQRRFQRLAGTQTDRKSVCRFFEGRHRGPQQQLDAVEPQLWASGAAISGSMGPNTWFSNSTMLTPSLRSRSASAISSPM